MPIAPSGSNEEGFLVDMALRERSSSNAAGAPPQPIRMMGMQGFGVDMDPVKGKRNITGQFVGMGEVVGDEKDIRRTSSSLSMGGWADGAFKRFAQPGLEENTVRSADIEGLMPNFVRRHREKPYLYPSGNANGLRAWWA